MIMKQKVFRAGKHSLAVIIPANFVHAVGVSAGDKVEVHTFPESGKVTMFFSGTLQLPLTPNITWNIKLKKVK